MGHLNDSNGHFLIRKASVGQRLGAFLIDHCIFSFIFVFAFVFASFGMQTGQALTLLYIFVFAAAFLVFGLRDAIKGQSIGKRALGIGVRDVSDNFAVPPVSRLFLRQILTFIWPIEFFALIFSSKSRKIGDKIAGTGVYNLREYENFVLYTKRMEYINQMQGTGAMNLRAIEQLYKPKRPKALMIIAIVLLAGTIYIGSLSFGITFIFRNHPSYHIATDHIRQNPEIAAVIGEIEGFGFMPSGSLNTWAGGGDANYTIRVRGTYGDVRVFIDLQMRAGGDWEIVRFNFVQIR